MKKFILILIISTLPLFIKAQKVYQVKSKNDANLIVYETKYKNDATLIVYKTNSANDAAKNSGQWFFTPYKSDAYYKVFFTQYKQTADVIVYYTKYKNEAGFKK
jgi:hypothetical protein